MTGNRLAERINLGGALRESDVRKMLERRVHWENGDVKQALRMTMDKAPNYGRFAFVRDVCKRATEKADGDAVTIDTFTAAITEEVASR